MSTNLKVLLVGAEAYPYAKVGGLADVLGALPRALAAEGVETTLLLPRYRQVDAARLGLERVVVPDDWFVGLNFVNHGFGLLRGQLPDSGATVLFLENDQFFDRHSVYNAEGGRPFPDDAQRWLFYQRGALEVCKFLGLAPDVVHAHDSQTGLVPYYLRSTYRHEDVFRRAATVFTIHNIAYQGVYGAEVLPLAGFGPEHFHAASPLEYHGSMCWMKTGIAAADVVTTVSPTYAREIQTAAGGLGLDGVLRSRSWDLHGVLNGIDADVWSPQKDRKIPHAFDAADRSGKRLCKRELLARLGLPATREDRPLVAFIGRLVAQKGLDVLAPVVADLMQHDITFVALGSGADVYENLLRSSEHTWPDRARAWIGFNDELAHQIEAGADIFLMPSHYEPCGLNQMYSMAYGTVPVVHATGGLADTVEEVPPWSDEGTGFSFSEYTPHGFKEAVYRALTAYQDKRRWERLMTNGMTRDFSWRRSARRYIDIYERAVSRQR